MSSFAQNTYYFLLFLIAWVFAFEYLQKFFKKAWHNDYDFESFFEPSPFPLRSYFEVSLLSIITALAFLYIYQLNHEGTQSFKKVKQIIQFFVEFWVDTDAFLCKIGIALGS